MAVAPTILESGQLQRAPKHGQQYLHQQLILQTMHLVIAGLESGWNMKGRHLTHVGNRNAMYAVQIGSGHPKSHLIWTPSCVQAACPKHTKAMELLARIDAQSSHAGLQLVQQLQYCSVTPRQSD